MPARVLVVEDDRAMAQMCAKLIRRHGHTVTLAGSGQQAIAAVNATDGIDVVISDVQMPEMSGLQLLAQLRSMDSTLPVILMTGYGHLLSFVEAHALGAADCIMKPFEPETLIRSLERVKRSRIIVRND